MREPNHLWLRFIASAVGAMVAILFARTIVDQIHLRTLETTCARIANWAQQQSFTPGPHYNAQIPRSVSSSVDRVDLVATTTGDIVLLLKTKIGWKGNYEGFVYLTRPLTASDIERNYFGSPTVATPELGGPIIKTQISPHFLRVYFDLG